MGLNKKPVKPVNIQELNKSLKGKYCTSKRRQRELMRIQEIYFNPHFLECQKKPYARLETVIGSTPSGHSRPLRNLIIIKDDLPELETINKKIQEALNV